MQGASGPHPMEAARGQGHLLGHRRVVGPVAAVHGFHVGRDGRTHRVVGNVDQWPTRIVIPVGCCGVDMRSIPHGIVSVEFLLHLHSADINIRGGA